MSVSWIRVRENEIMNKTIQRNLKCQERIASRERIKEVKSTYVFASCR